MSSGKTPLSLVEAVRNAIDHGTTCLCCGKPKKKGVDYCPQCKEEELKEIAELTKKRRSRE